MTEAEWFTGTFLLEAEQPDDPDSTERLLEKRVVLFEGQDAAEVARKAYEYCGNVRIEYENEYGERVAWRCKRVLAISPLYVSELQDGVEVYAELLESGPNAPATGDRGGME